MIILLRYCILSCKPKILLSFKSKVKTASCKVLYRIIKIVHTLYDTSTLEVMYKLSCFVTLFVCVYKLSLSCCWNLHL